MKLSAAIVLLLSIFFVSPAGAVTKTTFQLVANPKFLSCLSGAKGTPTAKVTVTEGKLNDTLTISLSHVKPNLGFDLFTIQRTNFLATGELDPNFTTFGLAWYQTDVQADKNGNANATIHTILVDEIFGFDPDVSLTPTNTFHVGIWFDNPDEATACGFTGTTPFNGEHDAGPNAMISVPSAMGLGPLCLNPSSTPGVCSP
jgi:hypothetical protein